MEEYDYKCTEDLGYDFKQVFHVLPNLIEPIRHATYRC
jgi:hypothetical protein